MTIQQLTYVLAVVQTGSFSRAAERCFVTQPTLSAQIQKLERELNVVLIDRTTRPISATPSGARILATAQEAIGLFNQIPSLVDNEMRELSGRLVVGIIPTLSQYLLPLFLKRFLDTHREVDVQIHEKMSDQIISELHQYRLDIGILATPAGSTGLEERPLFYEEFIGFFPPDYTIGPGDSLPEVLSVDLLPWEDMLLLAEGHCFRDQTINICHRQEHKEQSRLEFETGSLESLKRLVDQGLGYTFLPELATRDLNPDQVERTRRLAEPRPTREISALLQPGFLKRDLLATFERSIVESLPAKVRRNTGANRIAWRER